MQVFSHFSERIHGFQSQASINQLLTVSCTDAVLFHCLCWSYGCSVFLSPCTEKLYNRTAEYCHQNSSAAESNGPFDFVCVRKVGQPFRVSLGVVGYRSYIQIATYLSGSAPPQLPFSGVILLSRLSWCVCSLGICPPASWPGMGCWFTYRVFLVVICFLVCCLPSRPCAFAGLIITKHFEYFEAICV